MEEDKSILTNLKSIYIFDKIFSYIKDNNFKLKLLKYSKALKENFNIKKNEYINKYLDYCINEKDKNILFLSTLNDCDCKNFTEYKKTLQKYTIKYNIKQNALEEYFINLIEKGIKKEASDEIKINIYSPFLNHFINNYLEHLCFSININKIHNHSLNNDVSNIFKKMNESNINYKSLYIYLDKDDEEEKNFFKKIFSKSLNFIKFFNSLNINYDKIEKLTCDYFSPPKKYKSTSFYNSLLSSFQNKIKLIYLNLTIGGICNNIDIINEFKSLKYLYLKGFLFSQNLVINLQNLEEMSLIDCKGIKIIFDEMNINIKFLEIVRSSIKSNGKSIDLPNLETIILDENEIKLTNMIDFSSFKKIEKFCGSYDYLKNMNLTFLKYLELNEIQFNKVEKKEFTSVFKRIITLENLKEIKLKINSISSDCFYDIEGQNTSVTSLKIYFKDAINVDILNILLRLFPNITDIDIDSTSNQYYNMEKLEDIKMDKNLKIVKMNFNFDYLSFFKFKSLSFENLIELKLQFNLISPDELDINEFIFIFDSDNPFIFNSLKILSLIEFNYISGYKEKDIEKFLLKIFDKKFPNLEDLTLNCMRIYEKYYYNLLYNSFFLKHLKKLNLNLIFPYSNDKYSLKELKENFPNINFDKYESVSIGKIGENNNN